MKSLQDFASNDNQPLFRQAKTLPDFFHHNLVDPARVVKVFTNDPQANIRIFYYQYLKLCFQLDNVNYEFYINKIEEIINNEGFKFIFYEDDDPILFSDLQFKNLIMQFFGVLGDGNITIDAALNRFPVMDTVFIYFFRAFLILTGKAETLDSYVERDQLLQYLCNYFQVDITLHDKCIKFVQTDIFAYEDDPKQVFMAFMDYDKVQNQSQLQPSQQDGPSYYQHQPSSSLEYDSKVQQHMQSPAYLQSHQQIAENLGFQNPQNNVPPVSLKIENQPANNSINYPASNNSSRKGNTQVNQSYIASEFVDYTSGTNNNFLGLQHKANLKESGSVDSYRQNQPSNIKSDHLASSFEDNFKKPSSKPSGFKLEHNNLAGQQSKINTSYGYSQAEKKPYNLQSLNNNLSSYVNKTNFSVQVPLKKTEYEENKFYIPQNDWQPTKDPGFTQNYTNNQYISATTYQKPVSPSSAYQPISSTFYEQTDFYKNFDNKKPSSQTLQTSQSVAQLQPKKPTSSEASKPLPSYMPSYQPSYVSTYDSKYQTTGIYQTQSKETVPSKPSSGMKPFGLNVSLEFTNSFTMKAMNEPFKSNVYSIRQRARNFRNSLMSYIK